jgi:hypothetical protein
MVGCCFEAGASSPVHDLQNKIHKLNWWSSDLLENNLTRRNSLGFPVLPQIEPLLELRNGREIRRSALPAELGASLISQTTMKFGDLHAGQDLALLASPA